MLTDDDIPDDSGDVCGGTGILPVPLEFEPNPPLCGRCNSTGRVRAWT
jgi:hypothetical protein